MTIARTFGLSQAILLIFGVLPILAFEKDPKEETKARLLFSKQVLNKRVVQDLDLVLKYTLYNVGSGTAFNVLLSDDTFDKDAFSTHVGYLHVKIFNIPVGRNVSHTVILRPKSVGPVNISAATVSYQRSRDPEDVQIGESNDPGAFVIESYAAHQRKNCCHFAEWCYFAVLTFVLMILSKNNGFYQ